MLLLHFFFFLKRQNLGTGTQWYTTILGALPQICSANVIWGMTFGTEAFATTSGSVCCLLSGISIRYLKQCYRTPGLKAYVYKQKPSRVLCRHILTAIPLCSPAPTVTFGRGTYTAFIYGEIRFCNFPTKSEGNSRAAFCRLSIQYHHPL